MSDFTAVILALAIFFAGLAIAGYLARTMYKRCDDALSGVVNGVPVPLESRWRFVIQDYVGHSMGVTMIAGVGAEGLYVAGQALGDSNAAIVAYVCALVSAAFFLFNLLLGAIWIRHFVSVLSQSRNRLTDATFTRSRCIRRRDVRRDAVLQQQPSQPGRFQPVGA